MPHQTRLPRWGKSFIVKLQFQKRSVLELVSKIRPLAGQSRGAAEYCSRPEVYL